MLITKLILHQYKRLSLSNILTLTYTPESPIQLILGTNGSGKSSVLKELFPLPADLRNDYNDPGYKEIRVTRHGVDYVLADTLSDGKISYSFVRDNDELNVSGKKTLQMHLIKEHFNLDYSIRDILLGTNKFTSMSPTERKKWFIELADMDYEYVLGVYNNLLKLYKDNKANIKLLQSRLLANKEKVLSPNDKTYLVSHIKLLNTILEQLMECKSSLTTNNKCKKELYSTISTTTLKLNKLIDDIRANHTNVVDVDEIQQQIKIVIERIKDKEALLVELNTELAETMDILDKVTNITHTDKALLVTEQRSTHDGIKHLLGKLNYKIDNPVAVSNSLEYLLNILEDDVHNIPTCDDYNYTAKEYAIIKDEHYNNTLLVNKTQSELSRVFDQIKVLEHSFKCVEVSCPKCSYSWKPGYSKRKLESALVLETTLQTKLETVKEKIVTSEHYMEAYNKKVSTLQSLSKWYNSNPELTPILDYILPGKLEDIVVSDTLDKISAIRLTDIPIIIKLIELEANLVKYDTDLVILSKETYKEKEILVSQKVRLLDKINTIADEIKYLSDKRNDMIAYNTKLAQLDITYNALSAQLRDNKTIFDNSVALMRNSLLADLILDLKYKLVLVEKAYSDSEKIASIIANDRFDISKLEENDKHIAILLNELSPASGLIADSIGLFITSFITNVNKIIGDVWEYPMTIMSCSLDDTELDYKFPVKVDTTHTTADISKTSTSMKEIINLAFKVVFMKYHKVDDYPIYLDEFSSSMDHQHQTNAFEILNILLESEFNQIFLVSHYEHCYNRFTHTDINVLNSDNLGVVNTTNKVLHLEY